MNEGDIGDFFDMGDIGAGGGNIIMEEGGDEEFINLNGGDGGGFDLFDQFFGASHAPCAKPQPGSGSSHSWRKMATRFPPYLHKIV